MRTSSVPNTQAQIVRASAADNMPAAELHPLQDGLPIPVHHRTDCSTRSSSHSLEHEEDEDDSDVEPRRTSSTGIIHILHHGASSSSARRFDPRISWTTSIKRRTSLVRTTIRELIHANQGLLLIAASQLFFAIMNLGVKFLAGLSQPVPTFEVCELHPPSSEGEKIIIMCPPLTTRTNDAVCLFRTSFAFAFGCSSSQRAW